MRYPEMVRKAAIGCILLAITMSLATGAASAQETLLIKKSAGLTGKMAYWFAAPDRSMTERRPLPLPGRDGIITLAVPAKYWTQDSRLKILDLQQHRLALLPVQSQGDRTVLGPTLLRNGDFTLGTEGWNTRAAGSARMETLDEFAPPDVKGMAARFRVSAADGAPEHLQVWQQELDLKEGEPYTLTFWARANRPRPLAAQVQAMDEETGAETGPLVGLNSHISLKKEWQKYVLVFTASRTQPNRERLVFLLGQTTGLIDLAGIQLQHGRTGTPPGPNILQNGNFVREGDGWYPVSRPGRVTTQLAFPAREEVAPPPGAKSNVIRLTVSPAGRSLQEGGLYQAGCDLQENVAYTLSFWAKASRDRPLQVVMRSDRDDMRAVGMANTITVTEDWHRYSFLFLASRTVRSAGQLAFLAGDTEGTIDLADIALRPGIADTPWNENEARKPVVLSSTDFQFADLVRAPVTYLGRAVREATITLSSDGIDFGTQPLTAADNGAARFADVPLNKPLVFTVVHGKQKAVFNRTLPGGALRTVAALALPADWSQVPLLGAASARLASHPLLGAWESFGRQDTITGQEYQHFAFTFLPDESGTLETATLNKDTEAPTGPTKQETFHWNVAPGSHRITIGSNTYTWSLITLEQVKQLTLKGDNGKNYTLFRN